MAVDFLFIFDILLSFRTGFLDEDNQLVTDGSRVAIHYLRGSFFIDLIGSFPLNFILDLTSPDGEADATARLNRQLRLLRVVKLNRLLRLSKLSKYLKQLEVRRPTTYYGTTDYGTASCGTAYYGTTYYGTTDYGTASCGTAYYGTTDYGTTDYGTAYCGTAYYGTTYYGTLKRSKVRRLVSSVRGTCQGLFCGLFVARCRPRLPATSPSCPRALLTPCGLFALGRC
jgi:hypothetical protein